MKFEIYEGNIDKLEIKLAHIANKCKKYGCSFKYERLGEIYKDVVVPELRIKQTVKYYVVDVEGLAIVNGWRFVATLEHHTSGNIIRSYDHTVEVPKRYYTGLAVCEHCNTTRNRKNTYIIYNEETGEFKSVGGTCLMDFTHGLSAEMIADYLSYFNELSKGYATGGKVKSYYKTEELGCYFAETIRCFGFTPSYSMQSTKELGFNFWCVEHNAKVFDEKMYIEMMVQCNFDAKSQEEYVKKAFAWVMEQDSSDDYYHNLQIIVSEPYISFKNFGYLASLFQAYQKAMDAEYARKIKEAQEAAKAAASNYVGKIGERFTFVPKESRLVTSWDNQFGTTRLYEFIDASGNVLNWFASGYIEDVNRVVEVTGTVKSQQEYRGVKQTTLTRCKIKLAPKPSKRAEEPSGEVDAAMDKLMSYWSE